MSHESSGQEPLFRLCGEIDGRNLLFELAPGSYTVGRVKKNDIRLPAEGVSRRHATLLVGPDGLVIEDGDSKNGTYLDGRPIRRATATRDCRLCFGSVELGVEKVLDGAELALRFEQQPATTSAFAVRSRTETKTELSTHHSDDPGPGESALALLEKLLPRISRQGIQDALRSIAEVGGLRGLGLVEWTRSGRPLSLATWGELLELPDLDQIRELPANDGPDGIWRCGSFGATDASRDLCLVAACWPHDDQTHDDGSTQAEAPLGPGPPRGLALCPGGASAPESEADEEALQILLHLVRPLCYLLLERLPGPGLPRIATDREELRFPAGYVVASSAPMQRLYRQMEILCRDRRPVLLHGETGVGKELLARTLHASSSRAGAPQVVVNCAAIPASLLEAEMFGIEKGVATGIESRAGYFDRANGGTLFLDEIGELDASLQAKLLRTLQENVIQPVGGRPKPVDVWVIAATHVDPESEGLRRDLYYRLAGGLLEIPPLRHCPADIPALVHHYLRSEAAEAGLALRGVTERALQRLRTYSWPGNVRELAYVMRRLAATCPPDGIVDDGILPPAIRLYEPDPAPLTMLNGEPEADLKLKPKLEALERQLITRAMRRAGGRQVRAAELLGVSRGGLAKMLKRLDLKDSWAEADDTGSFRRRLTPPL